MVGANFRPRPGLGRHVVWAMRAPLARTPARNCALCILAMWSTVGLRVFAGHARRTSGHRRVLSQQAQAVHALLSDWHAWIRHVRPIAGASAFGGELITVPRAVSGRSAATALAQAASALGHFIDTQTVPAALAAMLYSIQSGNSVAQNWGVRYLPPAATPLQALLAAGNPSSAMATSDLQFLQAGHNTVIDLCAEIQAEISLNWRENGILWAHAAPGPRSAPVLTPAISWRSGIPVVYADALVSLAAYAVALQCAWPAGWGVAPADAAACATTLKWPEVHSTPAVAQAGLVPHAQTLAAAVQQLLVAAGLEPSPWHLTKPREQPLRATCVPPGFAAAMTASIGAARPVRSEFPLTRSTLSAARPGPAPRTAPASSTFIQALRAASAQYGRAALTQPPPLFVAWAPARDLNVKVPAFRKLDPLARCMTGAARCHPASLLVLDALGSCVHSALCDSSQPSEALASMLSTLLQFSAVLAARPAKSCALQRWGKDMPASSTHATNAARAWWPGLAVWRVMPALARHPAALDSLPSLSLAQLLQACAACVQGTDHITAWLSEPGAAQLQCHALVVAGHVVRCLEQRTVHGIAQLWAAPGCRMDADEQPGWNAVVAACYKWPGGPEAAQAELHELLGEQLLARLAAAAKSSAPGIDDGGWLDLPKWTVHAAQRDLQHCSQLDAEDTAAAQAYCKLALQVHG